MFEEYALREGSGGAGRQRGGFGVNYRMRMLRGEGTASFLMERGKMAPHGLFGAEPGGLDELAVVQGGVAAALPHVSKGDGFVLRSGDVVQVRTPGGGGYGSPLERDRALVARDLRRGYFDREAAERLYGLKAE